MSRRRTETWMLLVVVGIGLIPAGLMGLWAYMSATATPLHPNPADAPSVSRAAPGPGWDDAAKLAGGIVRAALNDQNLPGLSVAVGVGGDIVWAEGFGWADLEKRIPVGPDTRFRIGTASTVLTSAAVGLLTEQQRLSLDEEIQTYVPEFPRKQWPVTLRQLMAHVAGVPNDGGDEGPLFSQHCARPVDALPHLSGYERELLFEPGTNYHYSSYGWILVSAAVEAAAREPFLGFMQRAVFEPAGMRDTVADAVSEPIANRATQYFPRFAADPRYGLHLMRPVDYSCYAGSSAFVSTPSDLVRFAIAVNGGALLQPATVEQLQTSQRLPTGEDTGYGLGWDLETLTFSGGKTGIVGHDGDVLGGKVASLMTFPERDLVVAVVSNISYADTFTVGSKIAEAFMTPGVSSGQRAPLRTPVPPR